MQILSPDFYSSVHRTLVDIATLALMVIGLVRIILYDLTTLQRRCRPKKRARMTKPGSERPPRRSQ
jgi:hypothetical protein